jgi:hypothetical protein
MPNMLKNMSMDPGGNAVLVQNSYRELIDSYWDDTRFIR